MLSRRSILSRFMTSVPAVALAGGAAPALAMTETHAPADDPAENKNLLAQFEQFDTALAELRAARETKAAATKKFFELLPPLPTKLLLTYEQRHWMSGAPAEAGRILVGAGWHQHVIDMPGEGTTPTRWRATAEQLDAVRKLYPVRSKRGRLVRDLLPIAETYERGIKTAARKSKIVAACERYDSAEREAGDLARSIAKAKPLTRSGLRAKAQVISVAGELGVMSEFHVKTLGAEHLSADILRLAAAA